MQETQQTQVWPLGREDPLEEESAIQSSILAWKIPWTEEPDGLQSMGSQRVGHDLATKQDQEEGELGMQTVGLRYEVSDTSNKAFTRASV